MQPPPAPRMRSKLDTLIFTSNSVKSTKIEEALTSTKDHSLLRQWSAEEKDQDASENENEKEIVVECVDRPVDLYKVLHFVLLRRIFLP